GFVPASPSLKARLLRPLVLGGLRLVLRGRSSVVLVQNPDDRAVIARLGVAPDRIAMVRGNGVDLERFAPGPEPDGPVRVSLVARLIREKGVDEFVAAARAIRRQRDDVVFTLVGDPDGGNPSAVPVEQLRAWQDEGVVEWRGFTDDVPAVWAASHVAALPSFYGEGVPKSLIEAAACGRPIVTTDMPGCREIGRDGVNALLVPPRDAGALAAAISRLADDPSLRARLGAAGRRIAEHEFSDARVAAETLALWRAVLAGGTVHV
ncbi:MAG: glycosyltransferase family 4 protein, partial [Acidobacteria bacterium]|nr:glycosyltransferase family 4 protein [Acidobacteriota bacterium]